jgi:microcompartment protein CcmK/EutM
MARSKKVSKEALKSIIADGLRNSAGYYGGELQRRREKALEYYLGYPMGTEVEGRSRVISSDVFDTIESMLPSLLKPFTSSTEVVEFDPVGPEDEAAAAQVTQYCNHVFLKDNDGIKLMHEAFKDALLSGFGCFKVFYEEKENVTTETYEGLTDDDMLLLLADPDVEAVEHEEDAADGLGLAVAADVAPASTHSLKIRRTNNDGRVVVETVAPEDFYIERRARTLEEANFVAHRSRYTASDLIAMGYSKKQVDEIPSLDEEDLTTEKLLREQLDDSDFGSSHNGGDAFDPTRREVWLYDCYIKCDRNGDGIAEWVRVLAGGSGAHTILDEEEVDGPPFATLIPIPMPHRFFGMSLADQLFEIQEIKTSLWRNYLDNVYVQSNHRVEVVEGMVNLEDALNSRPGGVVRVKQPGMIREMTTSPIGGQILEGLRYADEVKEVRTGVTKHSQGLAQDQLNPNQTATGAKLMLSMAQQRIEMIGRLFADGGVKNLFKLILKQVLQHQSKERIIRIKGQWVPMDPRNWSHQYDVTVKVGLGHGNDEKRIAALSSILNAQKELAQNMGFGQGSIVSRENVFNSLADLAKEGGVDPNKYFTMPAPDNSDMPEPAPDPNQMFMQSQIMIENGKLEAQREKMTLEHQQKMKEYELKIAEMDQKLAIEREKIAAQMETVAAKIASETEAGAAKLEVEARLARERLESASIEADKNRNNGEDYGPP